MIISGMICSFSKPSAHTPMMKPNRLNVTAVSTRKPSIQIGCATSNDTNRRAVASMISPRMMDLLAAAPT
ncbi:hypothetical protein G6F50_018724 [Rhizopus delemar]|uniref:Uncharacterized protein n=1 Tax=Rhizopus delemar TaxID=936053 RepID=A0A9P7BYT6_9FUNG|nr:hypothetical protein G6F50_018724 [Rhizopus delemar]